MKRSKRKSSAAEATKRRLDERRHRILYQDLRKHPSTIWHPMKPADPFQRFAQTEIIPQLKLGNRLLDRKHLDVMVILANLFLAHKAGGKVLADSRDTGNREARSRIPLYDAMLHADMVLRQIGSEQSHKQTRYALNRELAEMALDWEFPDVVDPLLDEPTSERCQPSALAPVILRPRKSREPGHAYGERSIPFPPMSEEELHVVQQLEQSIMTINYQHLTRHAWLYTVLDQRGRPIGINQPNPIMRAIFNGDFQHGGRFYSYGVNGYQNLSKVERRTILIDGEPIAERDFSGFHTRLLYHKEGLPFEGDVYLPHEVLPRLYKGHHRQALRDAGRDFIKTATNIIINAGNLRSAIGATKQAVWNNPAYQEALDAAGTRPDKVILRIERIHKAIACYYHSGIGLEMQGEDAFIALYVMMHFNTQGKPALSLHDGILCKLSDADLAQATMHYIYELMYEFPPEIKQDWPPLEA
ncbi:MAG: hypothetical protein JW993_18285 [Sedimentisphaerales bacterium]|nr:hypothetical protein [Sedimentisphaerales bacterium]